MFLTYISLENFFIHHFNSIGYEIKRSWSFEKRLGGIIKILGLSKQEYFHNLRNTIATPMENAIVPKNHISQLMRHEDDNMALDVYSGGLTIELLREAMGRLSYCTEVELLIKYFKKDMRFFLTNYSKLSLVGPAIG